MRRLLSQIIAAIAGLCLAATFIPGVIIKAYPESNFFGIPLTARWEIFLFFGIILGLLNYFVRPLLQNLSLPLEIITLGFFSLIISVFFLWLMDLIFDEVYFPLLLPLLYTSVIIWVINLIFQFILVRNK